MLAGHNLALAALASWLLTEALGAFMVRSWIRSGAARAARAARAAPTTAAARTALAGLTAGAGRSAEPDEMSVPVLIGHAGLNLAGLLLWIGFVAFGARPAGWLALAFMAPAIGLGISTVTIWTPYPAARAEPAPDSRWAGRDPAGPDAARQVGPREPGVLPVSELTRALADEELSRKLVDELLRANLAQPPARTPQWSLRPLIPLAHGILAIATFLLAVLAVIAAL